MLPRIEKPIPKKKSGCKIRIKKTADGKIVEREISENCTPQQIKALIDSEKRDEE